MSSGRSVSSEWDLWDSIDKAVQTWISDEQKEGSNAQYEGVGYFPSTSEEPPSSQTTFRRDSSSDSSQATIPGATATAQPASRRLKRENKTPEPSCLKGYFKKVLEGGTIVFYPECHLTSGPLKCLSTFRTYGSRSCELSHYAKVNDSGVIRMIPTNCSCKA